MISSNLKGEAGQAVGFSADGFSRIEKGREMR
jgi:hypothetical protein